MKMIKKYFLHATRKSKDNPGATTNTAVSKKGQAGDKKRKEVS